MNVRLSRSLMDRCSACALAVGESAREWIRIVWRNWERGKLAGVVVDENTLATTRGDSGVVKVPGLDVPAGELRRALAAAVTWCEERNPKPFQTDLVEGRDFVVGCESE